MKIVLASLTLILFTVAAYSEPYFHSQSIFPPQGKHVHSSSIVETPNGDLLACWFHGSGERTASDVQILGARLKSGAEAWSGVFPMADTEGIADCNPILMVDGRDRLHLIWIAVLSQGWQYSLTRTRISEDYSGDGPPNWKWQDLILLRPGEAFAETIKAKFDELDLEEGWGEYALPYSTLVHEAAKDPIKRDLGWMPRIQTLRLPSGRILLPLYNDGFNLSMVAVSDDEGDTWRPAAPLVGLGPIQPTLLRRKNGEIVAYMRDSGPPPSRVLTGVSKDDGETWSAVTDSDIPNPGSSLAGIVLKDGRWLLLYNDTEEGRYRLALSLSEDEGKTWKATRHLEDDPKGSYAYPNLIQAKDGRIHMTYSWREETGACIQHVTLDPDWVLKGN